MNITSFWSTGGMSLEPAFKEFMGDGDDEQVMGIIYFGYTDEYPEGKRNTEIEEKITWVK